MKIAIASDHRGFKLKDGLISYLTEKKYEVIDCGTLNEESTDYPDYAFKLGHTIVDKSADFGIAICGSGIGISIACNKVKGVRCAKIDNVDEAEYTRRDNDANVISFSEKHSVDEATRMINTFLTTPFNSEEKYRRRLKQIIDYEKKNG